MLKFVPEYLKIKNICKQALKKFPFLRRYVPDWSEIQRNVK